MTSRTDETDANSAEAFLKMRAESVSGEGLAEFLSHARDEPPVAGDEMPTARGHA